MNTLANRDIRQRQLIPPQQLSCCHALVIGVGAIGRQVAIQLAATGVGRLQLIDFDTVAVENLAAQAYLPEDLGSSKVAATAALCRRINPDLPILTHAEPFRRSSVKTLPGLRDDAAGRLVVFACVDAISTRQLIWQALRPQAAMLIDGRMNAEVLRVLAVDQPQADGYYATTLFPEQQVHTGPCTARSTVYTAAIAAGLMLGQWTRWLRGLPLDRDLMLNLLAMELTLR